ncbi:cellulose-binding domain-containing protein [Nonomuraea sp. NPDC049625]|uniref:cellulose-binding domain-containing protein n=1 Tax=Nonomuraea sp. NPDC049625 TaxID=3155775 RepID=UPI003419AD03
MRFSRHRRWLAAATAAALGALGLATAGSAHAAEGCRVTYTVTNQWQGGFGANVTIDNLGDPVNGWKLTWSYTAGQTITQLWNGSYTQSGAQVTVSDAGYNGGIPSGGNASFGFNATWNNTANPVPATFALNGTTCTGTVTTTPSPTPSVPPTGTSTAWQNGKFVVDTPNVVRRSSIVFSRANTTASQFAPLGNGTLGAAAWGANGFTAQLNRNDTFPDRKSPGQVVIPGLSKLAGAADFKGYLDLYDGTLYESGGGMTLKAYVRADTSQLVVDVTGADPNSSQTAQVKLWSPRNPRAEASGSVATLSESWTDCCGGGASGQTFGTMAGVSAGGRNVRAANPDSRTAQVSFQPNSDGSFRVIVVSPGWKGGNALTTATTLLGGDLTRGSADLAAGTLSWWHDYWSSVGLIKITSSDGSGEYFENMRTLYLYSISASNRDTYPGTQAGEANLFNVGQDTQPWYPAGYWFWNLRMMIQANLSAGAFSLNTPMFTLYRNNLSNIAAWTSARYPGHEGICVPETMRFNGNGTWYAGNESCDSAIAPSYNSQTVTSGAEIGLWVWQTYLATDDRAFLSANYPIIRDSAKFLLSHARTGSDGLLHTHSNAHETQWSVDDPITDVAAMQALFPVAVSAAQTLGIDADLVTRLRTAIPKIRPLPRTDFGQTQVLGPSSDAAGNNMLALSAQPTAAKHNVENLGLEPVWPYNLIGDSGNQSDLAKRTFSHRSYITQTDWSFDALHAARLGLGNEMRTALIANINKYQVFPNGFASWDATKLTNPYLEELGVTAAAVTEGLVQDYDGTLRVAPGWPTGWDADGTVYIQHKGKAHVQIRNGTLVTVAVEAGASGDITVRNPWPGQNVTVVNGSGATVLTNQTGATITIPAQAGTPYLIQRASAPTTSLPFASVGGSPATAAKRLGNRSIGL